MDRNSSRWAGGVLAVAVAMAGLLAGGCVTETRQEQGGPVTVVRTKDARSAKPPRQASRQTRPPRDPSAPPKPNDLTDPCAARMHDLSGLILQYYAVNRQLPERVEELAPLAEIGQEFNATCPVSGRPYVYAPGGLQSSAGGERYLILYDAEPSHGRLRWGVFVAPPREGQPPATWVILMSETVFRGYVPRN